MKEESVFMTNYLKHKKKATYETISKNQYNCAQYTCSNEREISYSDNFSQHQKKATSKTISKIQCDCAKLDLQPSMEES